MSITAYQTVLPHAEERSLSRLAEIATSLCGTPIAFISVMDDKEMTFRARKGFDLERIPLTASFCHHVETARGPVVITDLRNDVRTRDNPLIVQRGVQFYAGHPIVSRDGLILGTVCVLDVKPRPRGLSPAEAMGLETLADQAASLLQHQEQRVHDTRLIVRLTALVDLGDALREAASESDAMAIAGKVLGQTLDCDQSGYVDVDDSAGTIDVVREWHRDEVPSASGTYEMARFATIVDGMRGGEVVTAVDSVAGREGLFSYLRAPVLLHGRLSGFMYAIDHEGRHWDPEDVEFARGVADRLHETVARMRSEAEREILVGETAHRLKNVMAVTRAIVMQTLSGRVDKAISASIDERLAAYSAAHDLLLSASANVAPYRSTVESVLDMLSLLGRVTMTGGNPTLNDRTTLALSLLVNELATNAIKHGSLSRPNGRVTMDCRIEEGDLVISWSERGGPAAQTPRRRGFGSRILQIGISRVGGTSLNYGQLGLDAVFRAPTTSVLA